MDPRPWIPRVIFPGQCLASFGGDPRCGHFSFWRSWGGWSCRLCCRSFPFAFLIPSTPPGPFPPLEPLPCSSVASNIRATAPPSLHTLFPSRSFFSGFLFQLLSDRSHSLFPCIQLFACSYFRRPYLHNQSTGTVLKDIQPPTHPPLVSQSYT